MECNQAEQMQSFIGPSKGQIAFARQFSHIDTVCRHAADLLFRESTGLSFCLFTGATQRATTVPQAKARHALAAELIHQLQHGSVQFISG